jgi:hypothetical protein
MVGKITRIQAGVYKDKLVLSYPVSIGTKSLCRYYPIGESILSCIRHTIDWLRVSNLEEVVFLELNDPEHQIFPLKPEELNYMANYYRGEAQCQI